MPSVEDLHRELDALRRLVPIGRTAKKTSEELLAQVQALATDLTPSSPGWKHLPTHAQEAARDALNWKAGRERLAPSESYGKDQVSVATTDQQTMTIDPNKWVVSDAPPPTRRGAAVQAAYDFFWSFEMGKNVLIPKDEASTARNAASQLKKESGGRVVISFRDEGDFVRALKIKDLTAEEKASMVEVSETPETPA